MAALLDAPDSAADQADADRMAGTLRGLRLHAERHRALGHGFGFTVLTGTETKIPVIPKSHAKINPGPFVETPFGPRVGEARVEGSASAGPTGTFLGRLSATRWALSEAP